MSDVRRRVGALSYEKLRLLARRVEQHGAGTPDVPLRAHARTSAHYPLSFAQERLWVLCQLRPGSAAYNNPLPVRATVAGGLEQGILEQALNVVVERHEVLRSVFLVVDGEPVQQVLPARWHAVPRSDLRALPHERREAEVLRQAVAEGRRPFDLENGPLLRLSLLQLAEQEYVLLLVFHHLISDGWSNGVFMREITAAYQAIADGAAPALAPPDFQYADYVLWQRQRLTGKHLEELLGHWRAKLGGNLPRFSLPADWKAEPSPDPPAAMRSVDVPVSLLDQLAATSRDAGVTLFVALLSAYYALLYRHSGERDLVVGTPVANRTHVGLESMLGLFLNTLALRVQVDGQQRLRDLLSSVKQSTNEAFAHQELPFERLVAELSPERTVGLNPVFQALFVYQNAPIEFDAEGIRIRPLRVDYGVSRFDLAFQVEHTDAGLRVTATYRSDTFAGGSIERLLAHYTRLLEALAADTGARVEDVELADPNGPLPASRGAAKADGTGPDAPDFLAMFAACVARFPSEIAVRSERVALSYDDLDQRTDALAKRLCSEGVQPGDRVAVAVTRSVACIVSIIATWKAGCAYVPFDPAWPARRIGSALRDVGAGIVLVDDEQPTASWGGCDAFRSLVVRDDACSGADRTPPNAIAAGDLAYVIFTSGSTGEPRGVAVAHRGVTNYLQAITARLMLPAGSSYAMMTRLDTDLALTMLLVPLSTGGTVCIPSDAAAHDPAAFASFMQAVGGVDCMKLVPSQLAAMLESPAMMRALPRQVLILAGEALSAELVAEVRRHAPECRIENHYGPTETTIAACSYAIAPEDVQKSWLSVPIGRPLPGVTAYVLDAAGRKAPSGAVGELCLAGAGLALGYWNRPEITAQRFPIDPFAAAPNQRMYRTGDLVRWRGDGTLEFRGRIDRQVKIRGYRVELEEIELAMARIPGVRDVAVVLDDHGETLVSFAALTAGSDAGPEDIRLAAAAGLPAAMVPSVVRLLDSLPRLSNGKVDHGELRRLVRQTDEPPPGRYVPPRDATELSLLQIWQSLLQRTGFGVRDDFFTLGGHSLLAVRMMAQLERAFGRSLPLSALFTDGTIERLAARLRAGAAEPQAGPLVGIQPCGDGTPVFFVHPAGGNVLSYYELARALGPGQPFFGLECAFDADPGRPVEEMATRYADAIAAEIGTGDCVLGGWSMGGVVAFEAARRLRERGAKVKDLVIIDQPAPDPGAAPALPDSGDLLLAYARKVEMFSGISLGLDAEELSGADWTELSCALFHAFRRAALVPDEVGAEEFSQFLRLQVGHSTVVTGYRPGTYPGKVVLYRGEDELEAGSSADADRMDLGWGRYTADPVEVEFIPGNHITIMSPPNVEVLAQRLAQRVLQPAGVA